MAMKRLSCALGLLLATLRPSPAGAAETNLATSLGAPGPFTVVSVQAVESKPRS